MITSLVLLGIGIAAYSISQLQQHGKLKWGAAHYSFWGEGSWRQKYKGHNTSKLEPAPKNFYYKYIARVKYKERWFTSTNLTVMFTDSYHALQSISFLSFAGAFSIALDINFFLIWALILLIHFTVYRLLQKQ